MIAYTFDSKDALVRIQRLHATAKNPRAMMLGGGREVSNVLKKHFREKDAKEPNKLGGRREHFWNQIARSTQTPVVSPDGMTTTVSITDSRFAQKVFGGVVRAKRARNLSIPMTAEAYGRSPSTFEAETGFKLSMITQRTGSKFSKLLVRHTGFGLQVEYLLTPRVYQDADPTALPSEAVLTNAFISRAERIVQRQTEGNVQ